MENKYERLKTFSLYVKEHAHGSTVLHMEIKNTWVRDLDSGRITGFSSDSDMIEFAMSWMAIHGNEINDEPYIDQCEYSMLKKAVKFLDRIKTKVGRIKFKEGENGSIKSLSENGLNSPDYVIKALRELGFVHIRIEPFDGIKIDNEFADKIISSFKYKKEMIKEGV